MPKTNGFVERLKGAVLDELFRVKMRETFYEAVEAHAAKPDNFHSNPCRYSMGPST